MQFVNVTSTYVLGILFPVLGSVAIAGRFLSRWLKRAGYSWDDWLTIPALILTVACGIVLIIGAATDTIGSHNPPAPAVDSLFLDSPQQALFLKLEVAFLLLSYWAIGFIRLVFLFLFRRIFRGRIFNIANWCLVALVCAWTVTFFIGYFTACRNRIESYWGPLADLKSKCADTFVLLSVMCVTDFFVDLCVLCLPLICVWQLNMKTNTKIGVSLIFLLGIFSVAVSCARMVFMLEILTYPFGTDTPLFGTAGTSDSIGVISVIIWFTMLEIGVGVITMNLPVLPGIFRDTPVGEHLRKAWMSLSSHNSSKPSGKARELGSMDTTLMENKLPSQYQGSEAQQSESSLEKGLNSVRVTTTIDISESIGRAPTFEEMIRDGPRA